MQTVKFITFGDGSKDYREAAERILRQSEAFSAISDREGFNVAKLGQAYADSFPDFTEKYALGHGLFSWKPFMINAELNKLNRGDILVYVDAGCELSAGGQNRFNDYLSFAAKNDALIFEMSHPNRYYTKYDPIFFENPEHYFRNQLIAGTIILKKCDRTFNFVKDWLALCAFEGGRLLLEPDEGERQIPGFVAHRHDQSCLSVCAYKHRIKTMADETWFDDFRGKRIYPILAFRNRTGKTTIRKKHDAAFGKGTPLLLMSISVAIWESTGCIYTLFPAE